MRMNKRGVEAEVGKQFAPILRRRVNVKLIRAAREVEKILMKEFEEHTVTKEIEEGAGASNISSTLGGYGNLFTYIGFSDSDNPIEIIRSLLTNSVNVQMLAPNSRKMIQDAVISFPSKEEIESMTPLPWASGRSWAKGIEEGISGLGEYLNKQSIRSGRSGGGVQAEDNIRGKSFRSVEYLSGILSRLQKNIQEAVRR
jgi:hypothetical protein